MPGDSGKGRKNRPDRAAIGSDGEIDVQEYFFQGHPVGIQKRPIEQRFGHLKSDEVFVCGGGVAALGCLKDIESELRLAVGKRIVGIRDGLSELPAQLRVEQRNRPVDGQ